MNNAPAPGAWHPETFDVMGPRKGDWIETVSGQKLWPLDIRPGDVTPYDVAHALSQICRFGGHCTRHYSVAEHCLLLSRYAFARWDDKQLALDLLVHDAAEAFLGDIPRPIKRCLPAEWHAIEEAADRVCITALGGRYPLIDHVKELDSRIIVDERSWLKAPTSHQWDISHLESLGINITIKKQKTTGIRDQWLHQLFKLSSPHSQ